MINSAFSSISPEGFLTSPEGSFASPEGSFASSEGSFASPEGSFALPETPLNPPVASLSSPVTTGLSSKPNPATPDFAPHPAVLLEAATAPHAGPDCAVPPGGTWQSRITVQACGRAWVLERAADMEALWEAMTDFTDDERLPYWTEVWPASVVLAQWLLKHKTNLAGQRCLDVGCGIGLTALVGQWLGACVLGMDYEPEALHFARCNAKHNDVPQPGWVAMDWRCPAVQRESFSYIWGGDIMYEKRFAVPVLDFFEYALKKDGIAWVAEPCRSVYDAFRSTLANRRWVGRCVFETTTPALYPQEKSVPVRIWELSR